MFILVPLTTLQIYFNRSVPKKQFCQSIKTEFQSCVIVKPGLRNEEIESGSVCAVRGFVLT
jgi:hypothetical protein